MSKTSLKNKEAKAKKAKVESAGPTESSESKLPNYNKCCTCKMHANHPSYCRKHNAYCGRKQDGCADYKVK